MLLLKPVTMDRGWSMMRPYFFAHEKTMESHLRRPNYLPLLSFRIKVLHPSTRIRVRLLGPCFKTGPIRVFTLDPDLLALKTL